MKKVLLIVLIFTQVNSLFSQINKNDIAFELRFPIPSGDNYLNKAFGNGYNGIIDFGIDYNIKKIKNFGIGILLNTSILRLSGTDLTMMILSPKIKIDYEININRVSIIPNIAFGYSNWRYWSPGVAMRDANGDLVQGEKTKGNYNGLTFKGATKLVLKSNQRINWYLQIAYEFTRLGNLNIADNSKYNRNMCILYPGIGLIWKFKKE